jgi:hypothetical protein
MRKLKIFLLWLFITHPPREYAMRLILCLAILEGFLALWEGIKKEAV